jgi:hypothetical protein
MYPDPEKYGYDPEKVPEVLCLMCKEKVGLAPYREVRTLARFGQMMFRHARYAREVRSA